MRDYCARLDFDPFLGSVRRMKKFGTIEWLINFYFRAINLVIWWEKLECSGVGKDRAQKLYHWNELLLRKIQV